MQKGRRRPLPPSGEFELRRVGVHPRQPFGEPFRVSFVRATRRRNVVQADDLELLYTGEVLHLRSRLGISDVEIAVPNSGWNATASEQGRVEMEPRNDYDICLGPEWLLDGFPGLIGVALFQLPGDILALRERHVPEKTRGAPLIVTLQKFRGVRSCRLEGRLMGARNIRPTRTREIDIQLSGRSEERIGRHGPVEHDVVIDQQVSVCESRNSMDLRFDRV